MAIWGSLGLAAIVLLTPQDELQRVPSVVSVWGSAGVTFALCVCLIRFLRRGGGNPWATAASLTMCYYAVRYAWGAIAIYHWEDFPWKAIPALGMRFYHEGGRVNVENACQLVLLGAIGLFVGLILPMKSVARALPDIHWPVSEAKFQRNLILYAPAALLVFLVLTPRLPLSVQFTISLFGKIIYLLNVIVGYWLFTATNSYEKAKWTVVALLLCITSSCLGFMTGQVGEMVAPLVFMVFGYMLARRRLPWLGLAVLVPIAFLLMFPFLTIYKYTAQDHPDSTISERVLFAKERFGTLDYRTGLELTMDRFVARMASTAPTAIFSRFYPSVYPFEHGRTFAIELTSMVPRVIWPDKPLVAVELNRYSAGVGLVREGGNTSAVFDAVAEYYVNFGHAGVLVLCFLHGIYVNLLGTWLSERLVAPLAGALNVTLFFSNPEFFGLGQALVSQSKLLPVWILVLYFMSRRAKTRSPLGLPQTA